MDQEPRFHRLIRDADLRPAIEALYAAVHAESHLRGTPGDYSWLRHNEGRRLGGGILGIGFIGFKV